jgi:hypothetical protein
VVVPAAPGVTIGGVNVTVAPGGCPVADNVTGLLNGPPMDGTITVTVTIPPCATGNGVCGAVTPNAGMIDTDTPTDVDVANTALPEYTAVIVYVPTMVGAVVVNVATPEAFTVPIPTNVSPL